MRDPAAAQTAFNLAMYTYVCLGVIGAAKWVYDTSRRALRGSDE